MRSPAVGSLFVTTIILAMPLSAQVPVRQLPATREPVLVPQVAPQVTTANELTLSRLDDAAPPTNLRATPTTGSVTLMWTAAPGAANYTVLRSLAAAGPFASITPTPVADTGFTDTGVTAGATYFYVVTATRPDGHYGTSAPVSVAIPQPATALTSARTVLREYQRPGLTAVPTPAFAGWGFADLHTHQAANIAFGGGMVWGEPSGPPDVAIRACNAAHGLGGTQDLIGNAMTIMKYGGGLEHHTGGHPNYDGWPMWYSLTHQQMYVSWLKRAVDGGLRLMVVDAVNNEVFCNLAKKGAGRTCDDMESVNLQIDQIERVQQFVDNQSGGPGKGWYRIVTSAGQARDVVSQGKLAVVLGIEVDKLFNCGTNCTEAQVRSRLQQVYDRGVRKLNPVHIADNAFAGAALYTPLFQYNNFLLRGEFFRVVDCSNQGIEFQLGYTGPSVANFINRLGLTSIGTPPAYPAGGNCNFRGLTPIGRFLIHEMMTKHMIIDVAHMSRRALNATLQVTDSSDYPVVASHSAVLDVMVHGGRSERALSDAQIAAIRKNGGLIGIGIGGGKRTETATRVPRIPNDCGRSSKSFAQHYLSALSKVGNEPVAFGSDINGLETLTAPRFGNDACGRDADPPQSAATMIRYPFTGYRSGISFPQQQWFNRRFDFNTDGFAQVGMYPDMIEDLQKIGLTSNDLDPLFRSADAFVRLWEKAESKTVASLP